MKKCMRFKSIVLIVGFVQVIIMGCIATAQPAEPEITVNLPGIGDFTIWQSEVIYTQGQRVTRNLNWWPDGNIGAVNNGDGTYTFYAANGGRVAMTVGTLNKPFGSSTRILNIQNQIEANDYIAGGPVYRVDENTLLLFYHLEKSPGGDGRRFYSMLGAAVSTTRNNRGHFIDFKDLGIIIRSNRPFRDNAISAVEMLGAAFAEYDGYLYVYFSDYIDGPYFWNRNQLAVARASVYDIREAINNNTAPVFMKYYRGGFTENGLGGMSSQLEIGNPSIRWLDISFNSYLNKFLMVAAQHIASDQVDLYLAVSDDGINWSRRILIANDRGEKFYPSIIGLGDDPRITGEEFYVYYTHSIIGAWDRWRDARLVRRRIILN